jgi:hypothetical protein
MLVQTGNSMSHTNKHQYSSYNTYLPIGQGTQFNKFYDAIWNTCFAQSLEILDDVMSLKTNTDCSI